MSKRAELKAEGFTLKANAKNAVVVGPPKAGAFQERPIKAVTFRRHCDTGDIPVALTHSGIGNGIRWKVDFEMLDYHFYLPLFFEGLTDTAFPYETFACKGIHDMLDHCNHKITPVVPQLITPIRNALNTRNHRVMCNTLKVLQHLVMSADGAGEALVPYLRQILHVFSLFKDKPIGDKYETSHPGGENLNFLIEQTLQMFERYGGNDAFKIIKRMVPTYTSCLK